MEMIKAMFVVLVGVVGLFLAGCGGMPPAEGDDGVAVEEEGLTVYFGQCQTNASGVENGLCAEMTIANRIVFAASAKCLAGRQGAGIHAWGATYVDTTTCP